VLNNLDVLLSFATILLGLSLLVMVLTQTISTCFNLRGYNLALGLGTLFEESGVDGDVARKLARQILSHPLLEGATLLPRLAPAIRREELMVILGLIGERAPLEEVMDTERVAHTIDVWFESTMDRISQKFAGWMRVITVVASFAFAFALQLDSLQLLKQLAEGTELRAVLDSRLQEPPVERRTLPAALEHAELELLPSHFPPVRYQHGIWGVLASAVLMSLGAPFWFNVLRGLSSLRPVLANRVDAAPGMTGRE